MLTSPVRNRGRSLTPEPEPSQCNRPRDPGTGKRQHVWKACQRRQKTKTKWRHFLSELLVPLLNPLLLSKCGHTLTLKPATLLLDVLVLRAAALSVVLVSALSAVLAESGVPLSIARKLQVN